MDMQNAWRSAACSWLQAESLHGQASCVLLWPWGLDLLHLVMFGHLDSQACCRASSVCVYGICPGHPYSTSAVRLVSHVAHWQTSRCTNTGVTICSALYSPLAPNSAASAARYRYRWLWLSVCRCRAGMLAQRQPASAAAGRAEQLCVSKHTSSSRPSRLHLIGGH